MADLTVLPSSPDFAFDMMGAVIDAITAEVGQKVDTAILIIARFKTEEAEMDAALFFLPDPDSLEVLLGRLGVV